jgi:Carboxypeptidase regulatory-like domain
MRRSFIAVVLLSMLTAACAKASDGPGSGGESGVRGVVVAGPQCPVESAESPCPDEPVPNTEIQVKRSGEVVATATSDQGGAFKISVPPGTYTVEAVADPGGIGYAKPVDVTVTEGTFAQVSVVIDTGIR